jgi:DNA-binding response OmpR family regulator
MKKILIVDDNPDVVETVIYGMSSITNEFEFIKAHNGREALEILKSQPIDLILLDIMMPEMDGWDVAASIKGDKSTKKVPIIFLTAKTDDLSRGMGSLTAEDYIEKPFDIKDLHDRIKKIVG